MDKQTPDNTHSEDAQSDNKAPESTSDENKTSVSSESKKDNPEKQQTDAKSADLAQSSGKTKGKSAKSKKSTLPTNKRTRRLSIAALVALLLIVAASASSYWLYQDNQQYKAQLAKQAATQLTLKEQLGQVESQLQQMGEKQQTLLSRAEEVESKGDHLTVSVEQINDQLKSLASTKGKDPLMWRIAEVEYLLSLANHRLSLEHDVATSAVILQDADKRLRAIGDPAFIPVRESISRELNQLNAVDLPDIAGMAAQLSVVKESLPQLPLVKRQLTFETDNKASEVANTEPETQAKDESLVKAVWNDIVEGLFRVRRTDKPIEPLLAPQEIQYLLYNLNLKLEQARHALLNRDSVVFKDSLDDVQHSLAQYFDDEDQAVTTAKETLAKLTSVELTPELPDISGSLRELRAWIKRQQFAKSMKSMGSDSIDSLSVQTPELSDKSMESDPIDLDPIDLAGIITP